MESSIVNLFRTREVSKIWACVIQAITVDVVYGLSSKATIFLRKNVNGFSIVQLYFQGGSTQSNMPIFFSIADNHSMHFYALISGFSQNASICVSHSPPDASSPAVLRQELIVFIVDLGLIGKFATI